MNDIERKEYLDVTRRLIEVGDYFDLNQVSRLVACIDELQTWKDSVPVDDIRYWMKPYQEVRLTLRRESIDNIKVWLAKQPGVDHDNKPEDGKTRGD